MIYLLLALYIALGLASIIILILDGFGWADVEPDWNRPWYTNVLSILIIIFGYSLAFIALIISTPITIPLGIVGHFNNKKEDELVRQNKQADVVKFEAWKRLPR